jgi:PAS domain S-box-containing protein
MRNLSVQQTPFMSDFPGILPVDQAAQLAVQLFESSPDCVKLLDAEGHLLAMNRNGRLSMEIDDFASVEGASWLSFFAPENRPAIGAALAQARCGETGRASAFCATARGTPKWWDITVSGLQGSAAGKLVVVSRDVTEQRQSRLERERLLREVQAANERMANVFQHAPAFMCILRGPEHVFEMANDRYVQLVGRRDILGQPVRAALPEIAGQGFFELLDRVYRTGETFVGNDMRVLLRRAPGAPLEERYVDVIYTALRDTEGQVVAVLSHGIDQTHRRQAEIALHESRERFQKLVSQAATGVVEMDVGGRITLVNQKFCQMLGYTEEELVGTWIIDVTAPDSVPATLAMVDRVIGEGQGQVLDKHYRRRDGSLQPATSSVNALRNAAGECHGLVAIVLDTTASTRAAEALRASEERYRTLFNSMDQAFCLLELQFDDAGTPVDWVYLETNAAFGQQTGLPDVVGRRLSELMGDSDPWWLDLVGAVAKEGGNRRYERESAALGRWFDVYLTRVGGEGSAKVAALFRDITERKTAEEQMRRFAADLEEADRRKTDFLATLAHELRNPLAPIRSGLGVMRLHREATPAMVKVREMMERQVSHMVHLIDDLLDIARISGGKLNLRKSRAALGAILGSAVETSLPLIEAARHALTVETPDTALFVDADATRIAQVVANLLNNAAKYTPPGGRITLALRREGLDAVISVSDTGVGIPPHALQSVFDMFSQVGSESERSQGGLGIGLSLVRQLVQMHGGSVVAESAGPGTGSCFTVRLPLAADGAAGQASSSAPEPGPDGAAGLRVLVVDDNADAAVTLAMILDAEGYRTEVAHSGADALRLAGEFGPAVVFLDIGMPGMNGYETAQAIRSLPGGDQPCLVALTGWGAEHDRARSAAAGFDHHLTKPVELATVQQLLAGVAKGAE